MSKGQVILAQQDEAIGLYMAGLLGEAAPVSREPLRNGDAPVTEVDGQPVPKWAHYPFQVTLLRTGGLTFALPDPYVAQVQPASKRGAARKDDPSWLVGVIEHHGRRVRCVDATGIATRFRRQQRQSPEAVVVMIDQHDWALLCDSVSEQLLDPVSVLWRGANGQRPWLAGVTRDQKIVLLDPLGLPAYLDTIGQQERSRPAETGPD